MTTHVRWGIRVAFLALAAWLLLGPSGTAGDGKEPGGVKLDPQDYSKYVAQEVKIVQEALSTSPLVKKTINRAKSATVMLAAVAQFGEGGASPEARATLRDAALKLLAEIDKDPASAAKQAQGLLTLKPDPKAKLGPMSIYKEVEKIYKEEDRGRNLEIIMKPFSLTRVGGLEIDKNLLDLGAQKGAINAADLDDKLLWMAIHSAVVAELVKPHVSDKKPQTWPPMAEEMRKISIELVDAVKKKDGKAALSTVNKLNSNCTKCHEVHRFTP